MRIINLLMHIYPKEWRDRYEEEFKEVIKESGDINISLILNILVNALATRFNPESYKRKDKKDKFDNLKSFIRKLLVSLSFSFILMTIAILIGMGISKKYSYGLEDVLLIEGLIVTVVGFFLVMEGNSSGLNMSAIGTQGAQYSFYVNLRITEKERSLTKYNKNFLKHSIIRVTFNGLTIPLGGILTVLISYII